MTHASFGADAVMLTYRPLIGLVHCVHVAPFQFAMRLVKVGPIEPAIHTSVAATAEMLEICAASALVHVVPFQCHNVVASAAQMSELPVPRTAATAPPVQVPSLVHVEPFHACTPAEVVPT